MKKLLALVLAMVMTLGLATVGASAATTKYADKNDINYQEAADVLSSVGVFEGKGENFAPKDNLNRAEAAKLVAYLMLGNKTAEAIKGNGNRFSDVPADHWAVGYIEYLATAGVVSGVGDGKFNPNGQVTAVQFAKMLNVALGYDAQVEGYVGESWNINIMKQANDDDIFKTLEVGSNDALTREQAAQMCLNALKADTVEYESKGDTLTINNSTVVLNAKKAKDKTTTDTKGNAIKKDDAAGTVANPYKLQLGEDLYNGDLKMEETRDDFGRPANKWTYKMEKIGTYAKIGDLKATYTEEIKNGPIYDLLGSSVYDHLVLAAGAKNYAELHYYEDGVPFNNNNQGLVNGSTSADTNKTAVQYFVLKNGDKAINYDATSKKVSSGNGTVTQVFVDKDDNVTITVMNTFVFKASSDYRASTEDITISAPSDAADQANKVEKITLTNYRLELKDFPQIKDYKKDDYLLVTAYKDGNRYKVDSVDKAEMLTGKVDKVVVKDSVTIDGELKKYNKTATDTTKENEFSVGQEATVVLDKYGYIVYVDEALVSSNYVFISELYQNGGNTSKVQANAYFSDGTNKTITIKEIAGTSDRSELVKATDNAGMNKGVVGTDGKYAGDTTSVIAVSNLAGWYTYSKNSSDEYTLTEIKSTWVEENEYWNGANYKDNNAVLTKGDTVKFLQNTKLSTDNVKSDDTAKVAAAMANNKTIMVVAYKNNTDVDVYTGVKNLPDINLAANGTSGKGNGGAAVFSVLDGDGYARYVFVSLEGNYSVFGTNSESLLYIVKYDHQHNINDSKTYHTYKALDEKAETVLIETDTDLKGTGDVYEAFYKTSKNADGRYTKAVSINKDTTNSKYFRADNATAKITSSDNNNLVLAGQGFTMANNSKIVLVSRVDELNRKDTLTDSDFEANIVTPGDLAGRVDGYTVTYNVQAKLDDNYTGNGGKIVEAYVTITKAVRGGSSSGSAATATSGILAVDLGEKLRGYDPTDAGDVLNAGDMTVYYTGSVKPTNDEIAKAVTAELAKYSNLSNCKIVYEKNDVTGWYDFMGYQNGNPIGAVTGGAYTTTRVAATETSGSSWEIKSTSTLDNLVIPEGVKLTVTGSKTVLNVENLIINGTLSIEEGAKVVISKGTGMLNVLKSGHIDDKTGSSLDCSVNPKVYNEGKSIETDTDNGNVVNLGTKAKSTGDLVIKGGTFSGTVKSYGGDIKVSGDTVYTAKVEVNGGTAEIAEGVVLNSGAELVNKTGNDSAAKVSDEIKIASGASGIVLDKVTVGDADEATTVSGDASAVKDKIGENAVVETIEVELTLKDAKITDRGAFRVTTSETIYTITSDTETITVSVEGTSEKGTGSVTFTIKNEDYKFVTGTDKDGKPETASSYTKEEIDSEETVTLTLTKKVTG